MPLRNDRPGAGVGPPPRIGCEEKNKGVAQAYDRRALRSRVALRKCNGGSLFQIPRTYGDNARECGYAQKLIAAMHPLRESRSRASSLFEAARPVLRFTSSGNAGAFGTTCRAARPPRASTDRCVSSRAPTLSARASEDRDGTFRARAAFPAWSPSERRSRLHVRGCAAFLILPRATATQLMDGASGAIQRGERKTLWVLSPRIVFDFAEVVGRVTRWAAIRVRRGAVWPIPRIFARAQNAILPPISESRLANRSVRRRWRVRVLAAREGWRAPQNGSERAPLRLVSRA
jgi:hypothetical protein